MKGGGVTGRPGRGLVLPSSTSSAVYGERKRASGKEDDGWCWSSTTTRILY